MRNLRAKRSKLAVMSASVIFILAVAAAGAGGAAEDRWATGANRAWRATSGDINFIVTGGAFPITVTCTRNTAGGSTVGSGPDIGPLTMHAPEFPRCADNYGGADKVTTKASGWKASFYWEKTDKYCPSGTGAGKTLHCVVIGIPKKAVTITINEFGCTQTIQPNGPADLGTTAKAPGGTTKDTFTLSNQSLTITGCGGAGSVRLKGTYTLQSPNHGVLVATS